MTSDIRDLRRKVHFAELHIRLDSVPNPISTRKPPFNALPLFLRSLAFVPELLTCCEHDPSKDHVTFEPLCQPLLKWSFPLFTPHSSMSRRGPGM